MFLESSILGLAQLEHYHQKRVTDVVETLEIEKHTLYVSNTVN